MSHSGAARYSASVGLVISRSHLAKATLLLVFLLPIWVPAEYMSVLIVLLLAVWLAASSWRLGRGVVLVLTPILMLLALGVLGSLNHAPYDVLKDVWYVGKAIPALILGYVLMPYIGSLRSLLSLVVIAAVIASLAHLTQVVSYPNFLSLTAVDLRVEAGKGYFIVVLGLACLLAGHRFGFRVYPVYMNWAYVPLGLVLIASLYFSFSRTYWASLLIIAFTLYGFWGGARWKSITMLTVAGLLFSAFIVFWVGDENDTGKTFSSKLTRAVQEIAITEYSEPRDINRYWRGFEAYKAVKTYLDGNLLQYVFGQGFGTQIDLESYWLLGDKELRFIPTTHNGYVYVLLKTGVIGLLLLAVFLYRIIRLGRRHAGARRRDIRCGAKLLVGLGWMLAFTTLVISGVFNKSSLLPAIIMVGLLVSYLRGSALPLYHRQQ